MRRSNRRGIGITTASLATTLVLALACSPAARDTAEGRSGDAPPLAQSAPVCPAGSAASPDIRVAEQGDQVTLSVDYKPGQARLRGPLPGDTKTPAGAALAFDVIGRPEKVPIRDQLPMLCQLLRRYLQMGGTLPSRFSMSFYEEMRPRLVAAAAASADWDRKAGRPTKGLVSEVVLKLMNDHKVYVELDRLFTEIGFEIVVGAIEKADSFVRPVAQIRKSGITLATPGLSETDRFPTEVLINYYQLKRR